MINATPIFSRFGKWAITIIMERIECLLMAGSSKASGLVGIDNDAGRPCFRADERE